MLTTIGADAMVGGGVIEVVVGFYRKPIVADASRAQ